MGIFVYTIRRNNEPQFFSARAFGASEYPSFSFWSWEPKLAQNHSVFGERVILGAFSKDCLVRAVFREKRASQTQVKCSKFSSLAPWALANTLLYLEGARKIPHVFVCA